MHAIVLTLLLGAAVACQSPDQGHALANERTPPAAPPAVVELPQAAPAGGAQGAPAAPAPAAAAPAAAAPAPRADDAAKGSSALVEPASPKPASCVFLCPDAIDLTALVEPPPKAASAEQARDDAIMLWLQERRTRDDEARAWRSLSFDLTWFDEPLGARLDATWYPKLFKAFHDVRNDLTMLVATLGDGFKRERPHANPAIVPCLPREDEIAVAGTMTLANGYPSGPALRATVFAALLGNLFEDRKDALLASAREVGFARTIGGVNYPSDVRAAEQLGLALARQIMATDAWEQRRAELRDELAAVAANRARLPKPAGTQPADAEGAKVPAAKPAATTGGER